MKPAINVIEKNQEPLKFTDKNLKKAIKILLEEADLY